jgi:quercetin dioxygenase-like cupin family protein
MKMITKLSYILAISILLISCDSTPKTQSLNDGNLSKSIAYADTMNTKIVFESDQYKMILFALKSDQILKPHSAPMDAPLVMLEGSARITIGIKDHILTSGDMITLPKDLEHGVYPNTDCKFVLLK